VSKTSKGYRLRWYDEGRARLRKAGFPSRSAARAWFRDVEEPRMRRDAYSGPCDGLGACLPLPRGARGRTGGVRDRDAEPPTP
jgi:hypothetical protein